MEDALTGPELFSKFMPDSVFEEIVRSTNVKMAQLRVGLGPLNQKKASYFDTTVPEMKCLVAVLIMSGNMIYIFLFLC